MDNYLQGPDQPGHINIKYFWMNDWKKAEERITVKQCTSLQMLRNFFTKPLQQVELFRIFSNVLLGYNMYAPLVLPHLHCSRSMLEKRRPNDSETGQMSNKDPASVPSRKASVVSWADMVRGESRQNGFSRMIHGWTPRGARRLEGCFELIL